jgi:hypothetical protein
LQIPKEGLERLKAENEGSEGELERRLIFVKMRTEITANVAQPTRPEIERYYNAHEKDFWEDDRVLLSVTTFSKSQVTGQAGIEDLRSEADSVHARLAAGPRFDSKVIQSEGSWAKSTWHEGWYSLEALRPELKKVALRLEPGQLGDVIETSTDFFIWRLRDKEAARQKPLDEVTNEISRVLLSKAREAAAQNWFETLRSHADIRYFPLMPPEP